MPRAKDENMIQAVVPHRSNGAMGIEPLVLAVGEGHEPLGRADR